MLRDQLSDVLHAIRYGDSRDKLVLDYAAARGITAREARARLKVERPEFQWQEK
jgi:hypothetical protein